MTHHQFHDVSSLVDLGQIRRLTWESEDKGSDFDLARSLKITLPALPGGALSATKGALGAPIFRTFFAECLGHRINRFEVHLLKN